MKNLFLSIPLLLSAYLFGFTTSTYANTLSTFQDTISVYIFLHEDCVISQYYTLPLRELHATYANEHTQFIGLFPNFSSKPDRMQAFKEKYKIPFDLKTDYYQTKTEKFGASVTPEVVVFNESTDKILYKGRIDNRYARVGKRRRVSTTSELKDALESIRESKPILVTETQSVGCFINKNKM